ncbi:MAG: tetratricopeptide repeat protein [Anaerolineae bacterium]|nr:tetratricopeptide repeat protein [Anaerolineae bacterium]
MALLLKLMVLLGVVLTGLWSTPSSQLNNTARLYLQNVPLQDEKLLIVNINLADVADLYGAEIQLSYNPAQLRVRDNDPRLDGVQIKPGPIIAFDDRFVVQNMANPETGTIDFAFTLLSGATPIEGEGVLATIVFEILGSGPLVVDIAEAQLVSSDIQAIPVTTAGLIIDGEAGSASAEIGPVFGRFWLVIGLGGGLVLVVLVLALVSLRRSTPWTKSTPPPPARRQPGTAGFSTRSSALLSQQGTRLMDQGQTERAYELFNQAIELDPANVEAWLGKGLAAHQPTERLICLQRVLALEPDNATAKAALNPLQDRPKSE